MNELEHERQLVERLAEEFVERYRAGERPSPDEYAAAHPQHADEIRELFPALVLIEELAPSEDNSGVAPTPPVAVSTPPTRVGDFRILREIGRGGMGIVYEAEQESLGRHVALKVLHVQPGQDARVLARFRRESRAAAQLHHTNIVPVFEVGQEGEVCYYAMQFIQGQALDQVLNELQRLRSAASVLVLRPVRADTGPVARSLWTGQFEPASEGHPSQEAVFSGTLTLDARGANQEVSRPPATETDRIALDATLSSVESNYRHFCHNVAQLGLQAADALAYAHGRGIIHRDIKPANLLLDTIGVLWVSDFGLAKTQDPALTDTGDLLGTLRYMAPERFKGECDARADVYALGLTLYELLVLRPAFDGTDRLHLVEQIGRQEPVRLRTIDPRIPRDLETIIMKAIEKDPRRRYFSAEAMSGDLRRFLADEPIFARRTGPVERLGRWGRRNPLVASLSAAVFLLAAIGFAGVFGQMQVAQANERQANEHAAKAEEKEQEAKKERDEVQALNEKLQAALDQVKATEARLRSVLYAREMNLAQHASEGGGTDRVRELLDQHRPKPGESDLRGFEWHYLYRLSQPELLKLDHTMPVFCVAYSPDGKRLASGGSIFGGGRWG